MPQRACRIDAYRAYGRQGAGGETHEEEYCAGDDEGGFVHCTDTKEHAGKKPCQTESCQAAEGQTNGDQQNASSHDHPEDVPAPGSQSSSYADLMCSLRYSKREHALETQTGQCQG
jgi:hypothetical protein